MSNGELLVKRRLRRHWQALVSLAALGWVLWLVASRGVVIPAVVRSLGYKTDGLEARLEQRTMAAAADDTNSRRLRVARSACAHFESLTDHGKTAAGYFSSSFSRNCSSYFVSEPLRTVYCMLPRAGSTSWRFVLANFNISSQDVASWKDVTYSLEGAALALQGVLTKTLCDYSQQEQRDISEDFFKFVSVRHPLERLYSSYKQKVEAVEEQEHRYIFHVQNRRAILEKTRPFYSSNVITFPRFVKYLTLENPSYFDIHWLPYYMSCNACLMKFDYIAKLETIEVDDGELFHRLNVTHAELPRLNQYNGKLVKRDVSSTEKTFWKEYSNVPQSDMRKLLRIYELDFQMYGYAFPEV